MWRAGSKWGLAGIMSAGLAALGYSSWGKHKKEEELAVMRAERIKEIVKRKDSFSGVKREKEAQTVLEKLKESLVVVYHPNVSGKSHLVAYIQSISPRPVLVLSGKPSLEANFQQFDPPAAPYPAGSLQSFQSSLTAGLSLSPTPLFILDSPERMPPLLSQKLIFLANRLKRASKADALVVSGDIGVVEMAQACGESQVHVLGELSKEEYLAIGELMGISRSAAEEMHGKGGSDLELLLRSKEDPDYPNKLLGSYVKDIATVLIAKPDLLQGLTRACETATVLNPLGDVYFHSEAGQVLLKAGVMVAYPSNSLRFRNKIAISALRQVLTSSN